MTPNPPALFIAALVLCTGANGQLNQGVRLAESPLGQHAGRVEVLYNGRWGTICDYRWDSLDANVICKMLNFTRQICAVRSATSYFGQGSGSVWLSSLSCGYGDSTLDDCRNSRPQTSSPCSHSRDAAVICQDNSVMPVPFDINQFNETTRTISLSWMLPYIPPYIRAIDFRLYIRSESYTRTFTYHTTVTNASRQFDYTITSLTKNQTYEVQIAAEGEYRWCSYNEIVGEKSEPVNITTSEQAPPSTLPIRLLPANINQPYIGRLEVYHNGQWGSVCNNRFGYDDANLACMELNYTAGAICYSTSSNFPTSSGPIWLDYVDCSSADRFEDCSHLGWGTQRCFRRYRTIGLVCNPGTSAAPSVTGFRITKVAGTSISLEWDRAPSIATYRIQYNRGISTTTVTTSRPQYTISRLVVGRNYSISVRAEISLRQFSCYSRTLAGEYTEPITVETRESAPDVSVGTFHITILNNSAVEATWRLPISTIGLNGRVRGFKIYYDKINSSEISINVEGNLIQAYIITGLEPSAQYLFSILIYTIADGPRSIYLPVTMPDSNFIPLIQQFGIYGDGIEAVTTYTYRRGFNVLCGSTVKDTTLHWQFANGSRIGISKPGFREGQFENGTAVLQIGTALVFTRRLTVCDGGLYTCLATSPEGGVTTRNFSLRIGSSPPTLSQPVLISKGSTWVQIGWKPLDCDGGYQINSYDVEYRTTRYYSSYTDAGRTSALNFTIHDLAQSTQYYFRVQTVSAVSSSTSSSSVIRVTTHPAGPSPPLGLSMKVTYSPEVCATWRSPATPNGVITFYKLYAESVDIIRRTNITDSVDLPTTTAMKTFHGNQQKGCIQLSHTGILYKFQISAVSSIGGELVEGTLTIITPQTTLFVPTPGIPLPRSVVWSATNASVTVRWDSTDYGSNFHFNVSYSGVVKWMSEEGVYISFQERGKVITDNSSITISPLTPSTKYIFKISVITSQGEGEAVSVDVTTSQEAGDKLIYFQLRLQNIEDCEEWHNDDTEEKLSDIREFLQSVLNPQCKCDMTASHISQGEFSCRSDPNDSVTYRARITGTPTRSSSDMADLIRTWVEEGSSSIKVGSSRFQLDPTCDAALDNIHAFDCGAKPNVPTKATTAKSSGSSLQGGDDSGEGVSSAQVVGIMLGGIIAGLLLTLLILLIVFIVFWLKKRSSSRKQGAFREFVNQNSARSSVIITEGEKTDEL